MLKTKIKQLIQWSMILMSFVSINVLAELPPKIAPSEVQFSLFPKFENYKERVCLAEAEDITLYKNLARDFNYLLSYSDLSYKSSIALSALVEKQEATFESLEALNQVQEAQIADLKHQAKSDSIYHTVIETILVGFVFLLLI